MVISPEPLAANLKPPTTFPWGRKCPHLPEGPHTVPAFLGWAYLPALTPDIPASAHGHPVTHWDIRHHLPVLKAIPHARL